MYRRYSYVQVIDDVEEPHVYVINQWSIQCAVHVRFGPLLYTLIPNSLDAMSHPARISLRAPPHLPFIQGFPGIPVGPSRRPPGVHGTVEIRVGAVPIKAKWVRVEIRKHEVIPPGFKTSSSEDRSTWEHVGEIQTLWTPQNTTKEFDVLETADFKFFLPLPENIPPTVMMMKESGIR